MIKKVLFGVCVAAVVVLAAVNVNFAINSKSKVNVTLEGMISLAITESDGGNCRQEYEYIIEPNDPLYGWACMIYWCESGSSTMCLEGFNNYVLENGKWIRVVEATSFQSCG